MEELAVRVGDHLDVPLAAYLNDPKSARDVSHTLLFIAIPYRCPCGPLASGGERVKGEGWKGLVEAWFIQRVILTTRPYLPCSIAKWRRNGHPGDDLTGW